MSMNEEEEMNEVISRLKAYLDETDKRRSEAWEIEKYYQLIGVLKKAKQLAKELDKEISRINPDFSALEKERFYQPFHQESD